MGTVEDMRLPLTIVDTQQRRMHTTAAVVHFQVSMTAAVVHSQLPSPRHPLHCLEFPVPSPLYCLSVAALQQSASELLSGSTSNERSRQCQMPRPSSIRWFQWPRQARSTWVKLARGDTARTRHTRLHIKQMCFAATGQHGQTAPELRTLVFF